MLKEYSSALWFVPLVLAASTMWGCAASTTPEPTPQAPATELSAKVGVPNAPQVTVSVDANSLQGDAREAFYQHNGAKSLAAEVSAELVKTGKELEPRLTELQIDVTKLRLRSTATGLWLGVMAGADILDVNVTLMSGSNVLRSYTTGVGGAMAGLVKPTAEGRFKGLVELVSERIVQGL